MANRKTLFALKIGILMVCIVGVSIYSMPYLSMKLSTEEGMLSTRQAPSVGVMPLILLIGSQKCGTSSLHHLLIQHPNIEGPIIKGSHENFDKFKGRVLKEMHFYDVDASFDRGYNFYRSYFPTAPNRDKRSQEYVRYIDSTPSYFSNPSAIGRIVDANFNVEKIQDRRGIFVNVAVPMDPRLRFILAIRDPTERHFSWYNHQMATNSNNLEIRYGITHLGNEGNSSIAVRTLAAVDNSRSCLPDRLLEQLNKNPGPIFTGKLGEILRRLKPRCDPMLRNGLYLFWLAKWMHLNVPMKNFCIIFMENLKADSNGTMSELEICLGIKPKGGDYVSATVNNGFEWNPNYRVPQSETAFKQLSEFYRPWNCAFLSYLMDRGKNPRNNTSFMMGCPLEFSSGGVKLT